KWQDDTYFGSKLHKSGYKIPVRKKHTAATARGAFYSAFIKRVAKRVQEARTEVIKQRTKQDNSTNAVISTALVLREKTAEVKDFHKQTSNARGKWSGYSGAGASGKAGKSSDAGTEAGSRAHIGQQQSISGSPKRLDA
ncbi:MAG: hypothetical protein RL228_379, partial [Actinomycetota bacterium]